MKYLPIYCLLVFIQLASCQENSSTSVLSDNQELKQLYNSDQSDRQDSKNIDWKTINTRDSLRESRVYQLLDSNKVRTAMDYKHAAMIFQHGRDTTSSSMAVKMMRKAVSIDTTMNKWLLAAAIDRDLWYRNKPQIFGTQYRKSGADQPWELYDLDSTQITDAERIAFGVPTLAGQREKLKKMNEKSLMELYEEIGSIDLVIDFINFNKDKDSEFNLSQKGINSLGYQLMNIGKTEEALKIFKLNTMLFPNAYNTFDSYGECLLKIGNKKDGINAYEKSLELNPNNKHAQEVLNLHKIPD